jgi:hypothetical protein
MRGIGAAVTADRMHDRLLAQARTGPPKRKRQRGQPLAHRINRETQRQTEYDGAEACAQAAVRHAVRRLREIERRAEIAASVGLTDAALRFAATAEALRAVLV